MKIILNYFQTLPKELSESLKIGSSLQEFIKNKMYLSEEVLKRWMDLKPYSYHTSEDRVEEVVEVGLEGPYSQVFGEQRQLLADGLQEDNVLRVVLHLTCLSSQRQQLQHFLTGLWYSAQLCQQVQTPVTNITGSRATTSER